MLEVFITIVLLVISGIGILKLFELYYMVSGIWKSIVMKYTISLTSFSVMCLVFLFMKNEKIIDSLLPLGFSIVFFWNIYLAYNVISSVKDYSRLEKNNNIKIILEGAYYVYSYENKIIETFGLFSDFLLVISRKSPGKWRQKYYFKPAEMYYLSSVNMDNFVSPTKLHVISDIVEKTSKRIIILDDINFLVLYNGEKSVLKFLTHLKDIVVVNNKCIIVIVDTGLNEAFKAVIEKEFDHLTEERLAREIAKAALKKPFYR